MYRIHCMAMLAVIAVGFIALPTQAQRLSDRIEHVRQQRAQQQRSQEQQARHQSVGRRLQQRIDHVEFDDTPAEHALAWWSQEIDVPVVIDWDALMMAGVDAESPVSLSLRRVPAIQVLKVLLGQISPDEELIAEATPWYVEIMTRDQANRRPVVRIYDIMDLLHAVPNFANAPQLDLESALDDQGGSGRGGSGRSGGTRSGSSSGGGLFGDDSDDADDAEIPSREERAEELMAMIRNTVEPELWLAHGGEHAAIRYYNGHLIVSAPNYVHRQIGTPIHIRPRPAANPSRSRADDDRRANAPLHGERRTPRRGVAGHQ